MKLTIIACAETFIGFDKVKLLGSELQPSTLRSEEGCLLVTT